MEKKPRRATASAEKARTDDTSLEIKQEQDK